MGAMRLTSRLPRAFHTFTFRLGLVYVAVFALSVVVLFTFIYGFAANYMHTQVTETLKTRFEMLENEYQENGSEGLESRIRELMASDDEGTEIYLLLNNKSEKLAGNLNEWPTAAEEEGAFEKRGQWIRFTIEGSRNHPESIDVRAITMPISKWRSLLVGQSLLAQRKVEHTISRTFVASLALTLAIALLGALIMTRSVMQRLSVINRSAETIMRGHLFTRIPFTPGGDEFDELSQHLNEMLDTIEALLHSLSQFANNIAHDLRSPLNRIVTRTEAGLRGLKEASAARRLLEKNVEDMEGLIGTFNSILRISELEAEAGFRQFEPCNLAEIATRMVEFYEPYAAEKHITVQTALHDALWVEGEKNLLTQALANLIDNAIKFTPEGGQVQVHSVRSEDTVEMMIVDNGPGIPPEYHRKVFEKFFRLEQSRSARGNGLGLSLVAAIARIHSAAITLEDATPGLSVRLTFRNGAPART